MKFRADLTLSIIIFLVCVSFLPVSSFALDPDKEKVLSMYVAYGGPDIIAKEFERATGIKVEYLTMSSGEVLARLRAE